MSTHDTPIQLKLPLDGIIEIPLSQGQVAFIDAIDADLALLKWHAAFDRSYSDGGKYRAQRHTPYVNGKQSIETMHRVILSRMLGRPLSRWELVDHEDLNPLNNCRKNLRLATHSQNGINSKKYANNTSGYKGVCWHKHNQNWYAAIKYHGKTKYLGSFPTAEQAYEAYKKAATELFGTFARTE